MTDSNKGIGAAIAQNLASKGANLVLIYNSSSSSEPTAKLAEDFERKYQIKTLPLQGDLGNSEEPQQIIARAKKSFADPATNTFTISIIVHNAGLATQGGLGSITTDDFFSQYRINVLGPLLLTQAALPYLPFDRSARIINVSSTSSSIGPMFQSVYGGTKAALEAMTRTWARELSDRGTVNAVNPGPVMTKMMRGTSPDFRAKLAPMVEMTPLAGMDQEKYGQQFLKEWGPMRGRPAFPEEVAGVVGMLCSAESGWCTGSVICANGGLKFTS